MEDALWDRFYTGAPARQRQSVEQYNIVKRDGVVAALPDGIAMCQKSGVYNHCVNRRPNGTPYRRGKGIPCRDGDPLMLGASFALLAA